MSGSRDTDITSVLNRLNGGDLSAKAELVTQVYEELRRLAHWKVAGERHSATLDTTSLVHDAYLRMVGNAEYRWENRRHFFGAAARAMQRILVDRARERNAKIHGGDRKRVAFEEKDVVEEPSSVDHLQLEEALEALRKRDARSHEVVLLRFYGGCKIEEVANLLGIAPRTVKQDWTYAKRWLRGHLEEGDR